ncbi:NADH:flavin oxidoreductase [Diplocloster agilis]|uniref:oxidoreductase n=1 Tax=Diplocloster agilis TaxID=2850323 RepID=UPI000820857C|nr:NADH:flavin oxidoreductase [Suonthocola fibrivorans]MCU6732853.1 NADH:flavin oxidoreductase [Suonthocola fibrivorans]SCI65195.1 NADH oxidase [uncultured Clostridium sp.]
MERLFEPLAIRGLEIKNRICMPPMVCYGWVGDDGLAVEKNVEHYRAAARGGTGLIIQEATCVTKEGRICRDQLGIWEEEQIPGLCRITEAVHREGCPIIVQIHHAGVVGGTTQHAYCPSDFRCVKNGEEKTGYEMSLEEIRQIQDAYIQAGRRAYEAGYDGVELHGCHQYLMCQFFNRRVNRRSDEYGREPERFALEILRGIRALTPKSFIIGIRLGAFEPALADGIAHAKALEEAGIDFLDISYGFQGMDEPEKPEDFPYRDVIYGAAEIKKQVHVPVFAVYGIQSPQMAEDILMRTGVDMVDIGRGILVNQNWAQDAQAGRDTGRCLDCKTCMWRVNPDKCAGRVLLNRRRAG